MADHQFDAALGGPCIRCGVVAGSDQALLPCSPPIVIAAKGLRPEPAARVYGVDDFDAIRARMEELRKEG
jgi:hypothetical protein